MVKYGQYGDQASKDNNQDTRHAINDPVLCTGKHSVASCNSPEYVVCVLLICSTLQASWEVGQCLLRRMQKLRGFQGVKAYVSALCKRVGVNMTHLMVEHSIRSAGDSCMQAC